MDGVVQLGPEKLELEQDLVDDGLRREVLSLSRALVKDEVVEVLGPSSMKPITTNGYHNQQLHQSHPPHHSFMHVVSKQAPPLPSRTY